MDLGERIRGITDAAKRVLSPEASRLKNEIDGLCDPIDDAIQKGEAVSKPQIQSAVATVIETIRRYDAEKKVDSQALKSMCERVWKTVVLASQNLAVGAILSSEDSSYLRNKKGGLKSQD